MGAFALPDAGTVGKKKIAFIRPAKYPLPNKVLPDMLGKAFPEYRIEIFDIRDTVHQHPWILLRNGLAMIFEYGPKMARGKIPPREAFYTTKYIYTKIEKLLRERINAEQYVFSFQIQSLFNASTGVVPHFVYTDHTHLARLTYPDFDPQKLRSKRWIEMERSIYRQASLIFTRSSNITKSLIDQYQVPAEKIILAGAGSNLNIQGFQPNHDRQKSKNILFVGIDWERKGGPDLLRAFNIIVKKHPDAHLTIVGCSPDIHLPNCTTAGKVSVEKMGTYFKDAAIFCLPTKMEPFGVAFIEALYNKLPIVATNIGAIPDFVKDGENGYLVDPGDVDELARHLDILLSDPALCTEFGQKGYKLATANYSWEMVSEKISAAIRSILM
jgi:glycosyltransferase involved in cell wall biosynthesis